MPNYQYFQIGNYSKYTGMEVWLSQQASQILLVLPFLFTLVLFHKDFYIFLHITNNYSPRINMFKTKFIIKRLKTLPSSFLDPRSLCCDVFPVCTR